MNMALPVANLGPQFLLEIPREANNFRDNRERWCYRGGGVITDFLVKKVLPFKNPRTFEHKVPPDVTLGSPKLQSLLLRSPGPSTALRRPRSQSHSQKSKVQEQWDVVI